MTERHISWPSASRLGEVGCAHGINLRADDTGDAAARDAAASGYVTLFLLQGNPSGTPTHDQQVKEAIVTALADWSRRDSDRKWTVAARS